MLVGDMTFEKLPNFKYLGVDINERTNSHGNQSYNNSREKVLILSGNAV